MNKDNFNNENEYEVGEETTKYGEFISSYFAWIPLSEQKEKANRLQEITKNKEKTKKNKKKWEINKNTKHKSQRKSKNIWYTIWIKF